MKGKCLIASLRTLKLMSSPRERIYRPMNCSQRFFPKHSLMLLKSWTATMRLSSFSSSWAISMTCLRTKSPLSLSLSLCARDPSYLPACSLTCVARALRLGGWSSGRSWALGSVGFWCCLAGYPVFRAVWRFLLLFRAACVRFRPCPWSVSGRQYDFVEEGFQQGDGFVAELVEEEGKVADDWASEWVCEYLCSESSSSYFSILSCMVLGSLVAMFLLMSSMLFLGKNSSMSLSWWVEISLLSFSIMN